MALVGRIGGSRMSRRWGGVVAEVCWLWVSGVMSGLKRCGVLDLATWVSGISGGGWLLGSIYQQSLEQGKAGRQASQHMRRTALRLGVSVS
jgi:hypothetical protein